MYLISSSNNLLIFVVLMICVSIGILGDKYHWFGKISGILVTISLAALATSTGLIPSASDTKLEVATYSFVFDFLVPISIPLLLFQVNLKKIINESGRLLAVFLIGSLGIVAGAIIASAIISFGDETYKIAGVFIGTYTGGSVNFMAVASTLDFLRSDLFPTVITVDNVFTNLYFMFLFLIPAVGFIARQFSSTEKELHTESPPSTTTPIQIDLEQISTTLLVALLTFGCARIISPSLQNLLGTEISLEILLITILITVVANIFPSWLSKYADTAFSMGMVMMYIFLAVIGASCDIMVLLQTSYSMLIFVIIILLVHLACILIGGKLLGVSLEEVLIASAANAGGPSISAPMAANFGMTKLVTPAILIGIMGYLIGTFLGVGVGLFLQ